MQNEDKMSRGNWEKSMGSLQISWLTALCVPISTNPPAFGWLDVFVEFLATSMYFVFKFRTVKEPLGDYRFRLQGDRSFVLQDLYLQSNSNFYCKQNPVTKFLPP